MIVLNAQLGLGSSSRWDGAVHGELSQALRLGNGLWTLMKWAHVVAGNQSSDLHISAFIATPVPFLSSLHCALPPSLLSQSWTLQSVSPRPLQTQQQAPVSRFNKKSPSERLGPKFYGGSGPNGLPRNSTSTALYPLGAAKCKQLW